MGTGYFDDVAQTIAGGNTSTAALANSTEAEQFTKPAAPAKAPQVAPPSRNAEKQRPEAGPAN